MINKRIKKYEFKDSRLSTGYVYHITGSIPDISDIEYFRTRLVSGLRIPDELLRGGIPSGELGVVMSPPSMGGTLNPCWEILLEEE